MAGGTIFIVWLRVMLCVLRVALLCGFYPAMLASLDILAIQAREGGNRKLARIPSGEERNFEWKLRVTISAVYQQSGLFVVSLCKV